MQEWQYHCSLPYIFYGNAMTVIALMTLAQFFYGMAFAASPALYADTVAYATWKSGKKMHPDGSWDYRIFR